MNAMPGEEVLAESRATFDWRIRRALDRLELARKDLVRAGRLYDQCRDESGSDAAVLADLREGRFLAEVAVAARAHEYDAVQDQAAIEVGRPRW